VSNGTGEGGKMEEKYWKEIEKKTWSSLSLVNFVHTFRALVSSFFVHKSLFLSHFNLFQSHSFKICKVKIPQLLSFSFNFSSMKFFIWGSVLAVKNFFSAFLSYNHTLVWYINTLQQGYIQNIKYNCTVCYNLRIHLEYT
jgi:hypothetical protein